MDSGAFAVHMYACTCRNTVVPYLSRSRHESRLQLLVTVVRVAREIDSSSSRFSYVSNLAGGFPLPIVLYYLVSFKSLLLNSKTVMYIIYYTLLYFHFIVNYYKETV